MVFCVSLFATRFALSFGLFSRRLLRFLLLGPHTEYRDHSHAPREVYLVLTAGPQWRVDGGDWFAVEPGQVVFHPSRQLHALRARSTPLLVFAAWLDRGERAAIAI